MKRYELQLISSRGIVFIGVTLLAFSLPYIGVGSFVLRLLITYYLYVMMTVLWNFIGGFVGMLNLGQAAFFGLGAYAYAYLVISGVNPFLAMLISPVLSATLAIITIPTFRLRADYFALGTMVLPFITQYTIESIGGLSIISIPRDFRFSLAQNYLTSLILMLSSFTLIYMLMNTRYGYALKAIGCDEDVTRSLGVNVFRYKLVSLLIYSSLVGLGGAFYIQLVPVMTTYDVFSLNWTLLPIFMTLIGGIRTFIGPIVGPVFYIFLSRLLSVVFAATGLDLLVLAVIIFLVVKYIPHGLIIPLTRLIQR